MSGSRSPWTYSDAVHPFNGIPLEVAGQLLDADSRLAETGIQGYFNHFDQWEGPTADAAAPGTGGWLCTSVDGGGDAGESVDVRDAVKGGVLRILTNDADNDNTQIQLNGGAFQYVVGKQLWCFANFALEDADDGEFAFGLILPGSTDVINTVGADNITLTKAETATDLSFTVRKSGSSTTEAGATGLTLADDTFVTAGFKVETNGDITVWSAAAGSVLAKRHTVDASTANIPDDVLLTPAIAVQTGAAATRYVDLGWFMCLQEI